jgi:L-asparaginase / beta-aspartyl-peptidase
MSQPNQSPYSIVLHAGAAESWHGSLKSYRLTVEFLDSVVEKAKLRLSEGAPAIDVVTEVTMALEDYPEFNAGRGSALNIEGFHEVSAPELLFESLHMLIYCCS